MRSKEEEYFSWYLDELVEAGFVEKYFYESSSFLLIDRYHKNVIKKMKTKEVVKEKTILQPHRYTPDFKVCFKSVPDFLLSEFTLDNDWWVDVKGGFNRHGGDRIFPINQKLMWEKHRILVEKIVPQELFKKTFTPIKYLKTDISNKDRKIGWKIQLLKELTG